MFEIYFSSQSRKFLKQHDPKDSERILSKIKKLQEMPIMHDSKRIQGTNYFRIRIGKFRVVYEVDYKTKILGIVSINKRSRAYG